MGGCARVGTARCRRRVPDERRSPPAAIPRAPHERGDIDGRWWRIDDLPVALLATQFWIVRYAPGWALPPRTPSTSRLLISRISPSVTGSPPWRYSETRLKA